MVSLMVIIQISWIFPPNNLCRASSSLKVLLRTFGETPRALHVLSKKSAMVPLHHIPCQCSLCPQATGKVAPCLCSSSWSPHNTVLLPEGLALRIPKAANPQTVTLSTLHHKHSVPRRRREQDPHPNCVLNLGPAAPKHYCLGPEYNIPSAFQ